MNRRQLLKRAFLTAVGIGGAVALMACEKRANAGIDPRYQMPPEKAEEMLRVFQGEIRMPPDATHPNYHNGKYGGTGVILPDNHALVLEGIAQAKVRRAKHHVEHDASLHFYRGNSWNNHVDD